MNNALVCISITWNGNSASQPASQPPSHPEFYTQTMFMEVGINWSKQASQTHITAQNLTRTPKPIQLPNFTLSKPMVFDFSTDQLNFSDVETFFTAKDLITNLATNLILIAKLIQILFIRNHERLKFSGTKGRPSIPDYSLCPNFALLSMAYSWCYALVSFF